jgi:EAL domain-containing protein (putative c-di-GMP-specific phosphodiesterase class I)
LAGEHQSPSEESAGGAGAASAVRYQPFGRKPLRTFALIIGLPAFLLYVSSVVLVILALVLMAREIDRLEEQRGLTAMAAALETFLHGLSDAVADEGTWNEAHLNVVIEPDPAWMDQTWGATARLGTTYDDVFVTDQEGTIVFGENAVGAMTGMIADHYTGAAAMLEEIDKAIPASGDAAVVSHFVADDKNKAAGLAAISVHKSTPGEIAVPRHQRRILWIAKHLTPAILQDMAIRYQVPLPEMVTEVGDGVSSIAIQDGRGNTAGIVAWAPDRPGDIAFRHAAVLTTFIFFGIGTLLVFGLGALRRAMLRRAAAIEQAFAEQAHDAQIAVAAAEVVAQQQPVEDEAKHTAIDGVSASNFDVEYQPIFDLRAEAMIGVETLLRWTKPDKSLLLQEDLTEEECAFLMERASIVALRHAASELAPFLGVTLSLAITAEQLRSGVFAEKVGGTLSAVNFQIRRLQLHTDVALLPDVDLIAPHIRELRSMGATIALSNFALDVETAPFMRPGFVDRIVLARSMVEGTDGDPARLKLVEATIEAARDAGLAVTVPFTARKEEAARLLRLGCREFRGPLLANPMPLGALTALILAPARPKAG